ncbi:MAG: ABC transporter ATP-binding protein [Phycisphaerae bacterium]|nr:ABC transporter ATP-binding protein [Phycisphaerae bacterium]
MLRLENVTKTYRTRNGTFNALDDVSLHIEAGEFAVIRGASGCGKTTLLMTFAGMLRPTRGTVLFGDRDLYRMGSAERACFRAQNLGFVFQMFHLVPYLSIAENVLLPAAAAGLADPGTRAAELIDKLGLASRRHHDPTQLSAGEKQRTAVARAMLNEPRVILADEPTGNLDPDNARAVLGHLAEYHKGGGTVVIVTHGPEAAQFADKIIHLNAGRIDSNP